MIYTEPPMYPRPVAEVIGEWMLRSGKTREAEAAFRVALDQYPDSKRSKVGLKESLRRANKPVEAGL